MAATIFSKVSSFMVNDAVKGEIGRVKGFGPVMVVCTNQYNVDCVITAHKISASGVVGMAELSGTATQVSAEDSGYDGNGTLRSFSGQALNHLPIVPKSVTVTPATSGTVLVDGGDGKLYTVDEDNELAGTIDYFTGDLILAYPVGKAPTGQLNVAYKYEDECLKRYGIKTYLFSSLREDQTLVIGGACKKLDTEGNPNGSALVSCEIVVAGNVESCPTMI